MKMAVKDKCWSFLEGYLLSKDKPDHAKADVVKRLYSLKSVKSVEVTVGDVKQILQIRYRREDYPELKEWRIKVFARDKFSCVKCGSAKNIVAHHIKRWADYPDLRFDIDNGQTLCKRCHSKTDGFLRRYNAI